MMRELSHPSKDDLKLVEVLHALADPVRLEIVARLDRVGTENCTGIGGGIDVHKSTMSHHYRVLREAGITLTTLEGRSRLVSVRHRDLNDRFPGLLDSVLAALRTEATREP